jgi:hypothetical protein
MAQVTMTGNEYAEMLRKIEQGAEIIRLLKEERKIKFTEDNIRTYSAGEFPNRSKFPEGLQDLLVQDMVNQLLHMSAEEFSLWALTDCYFYNPKSRDMDSWLQDDKVNLLEISPELKERWDLARTEYHSGNKEDNEDGE